MEGPAILLQQHPAAEKEARAGDGAACSQQHPRMIQVFRFAQKPQPVAGRDPVIAVILGISVARHDVVSVGEGFVHPLDVIRTQEVIRIKDEVAVKALRLVLRNVPQQGVEGVALAHLFAVNAFVDRRARRARHVRGTVRTVVRHDENLQLVLRVGLPVQAVDQVGNDLFLIARTDQNGIAVQLRRLVRLILFDMRNQNVEKLIGIAHQKSDHQYGVHRFKIFHPDSPFLYVVLSIPRKGIKKQAEKILRFA